MTTPSRATILELLAACEQLAEGYARALRAVQNLTSAGLEGRDISIAVLHEYDEQAEKAAADLEGFRAMVAQFKTQFTVH
jgi:hypothetical protein